MQALGKSLIAFLQNPLSTVDCQGIRKTLLFTEDSTDQAVYAPAPALMLQPIGKKRAETAINLSANNASQTIYRFFDRIHVMRDLQPKQPAFSSTKKNRQLYAFNAQ